MFTLKESSFQKTVFPKTPSSKMLGTYKLGNIDKLIKTPTIVKAPNLRTTHNESKVFKVTVKDKKNK